MKARHRFDPAPAASTAASAAFAAPESRFDRANREWNVRNGAAIAGVKRWRIIALSSLVVTLLLSLIALRLATDVRLVPYVVRFDTGSAPVAVRRADTPPTPGTVVVRSQLASWIGDARSISGDPIVERTTLARVYAGVGPSAKPYLDAWYSAHLPFATANVASVTVHIDAVAPRGADTYEIQWTEEQRDHTGANPQTTLWEAQITAAIRPSSDLATIVRNPLGIYVTQLSWTQRV